MNRSTDRPEPGRVYRLTGAADQPSIARGDSWAASEVEPPEDPVRAALRALLDAMEAPRSRKAAEAWDAARRLLGGGR